MSETYMLGRRTGAARAFPRSLPGRLWPLLVLTLVMAGAPAWADEAEEQYLRVFLRIERADTLEKSGQGDAALAKYREAQEALQAFRARYPGWNPKLVEFRWKDLGEKLAPPPEDGTSAAALAAASKPDPGAAKAGAGSSSGEVKLISAGAEPRRALRFHPTAGDKQTIGSNIKMAMEMKIGEMDAPAFKMPELNLDMEVTVKEVSGDGETTYEMTWGEATLVEDPDATPQVVEAMKAAMAAFKGASGTGRVNNRGLNRGVEIKGGGESSATARQAMDQIKDTMQRMSAPLPEEAIGVGAKWEIKATVKSQGLTLDQATTYELVALEGERATIKSTFTQSAPKQKMESPAMPGMKLDVVKMKGQGGGSATVDLAKLMPVEGLVDSRSEVTMGMDLGGQKQMMDMKTDVKVRMQSK